MCTPIYHIHNVTLWSCPITSSCPIVDDSVINLSPTNSTNSTNSTTTNSTTANSTNSTTANSTNSTTINSTNSTIATIQQHNPTPSPDPTPSPNPAPNPTPSPSSSLLLFWSTTDNNTNNTFFLRHGNNKTNNTSVCVCNHDLRWLHILWVIPLILVICCCYWVKRRGTTRIKNLFMPRVSKYLKRSRSWPEISVRDSPIENRARSEPLFDTIVF